MELSTYVDSLWTQLVVTAEAGGEEARELAERLAASLEAAARLSLLEALSAAADEITRELAPGSVEVRLRGNDPEFVVTPPPSAPSSLDDADFDREPPPPAMHAVPPPAEGDEAGTSRITLRLPSHLKPRIDEAAERAGLSANAWLVRAIAAALQPDDRRRTATDRRPPPMVGRRYTGWVR